jgi:hypothetical protein
MKKVISRKRFLQTAAQVAAVLADKTVENAIRNGISEHYDSASGMPPGIPDYCMSSSIATMMLDGLTKKFQLKLKK